MYYYCLQRLKSESVNEFLKQMIDNTEKGQVHMLIINMINQLLLSDVGNLSTELEKFIKRKVSKKKCTANTINSFAFKQFNNSLNIVVLYEEV